MYINIPIYDLYKLPKNFPIKKIKKKKKKIKRK